MAAQGCRENSQKVSGAELNDCISSLLEAENTATVGKKMGFEMEMDNPILSEVLGDVGANRVIY